MEQTEQNEFAQEFFKKYEPKRTFRWTLEIEGINSWQIKCISWESLTEWSICL